MFLSQARINEAILYCILADVVMAYILKRVGAAHINGPVALIYLMNFTVLAGVYRFWKFPVFEWSDKGFIFYGISPFRKSAGLWEYTESGGFRHVETKRGRAHEHLIIVYRDMKGVTKTGAVPMGMVGFADKVKKELLATLREKKIKPL